MNQMSNPSPVAKSKSTKSESGVTLPLVAMMMVTLLGLAAFAVDLGWFYLNASRVQRAADAAALAGVIYMPNDATEAGSVAHEIAQANGYLDQEIPGVFPTVEAIPVSGKPTQLQVTISEQVPTFFLKVFGMSTQVITRTAQAEFVPPLPLGSPDNQFGNACDPGQAGCTGQANFWANIHGRYTDNEMGDAYSSACTAGSGSPCSPGTFNPLWDETTTAPGYLYGVERASAGTPFTVQFTDIAFHNSSGAQTNGDYVRTGDNGCPALGGSTAVGCGPTMRVSLYAPDPDPLDLTNNTLLCTQDIAPLAQVAPGDPYGFSAPSGCFTVGLPEAGIYVVQVRVLGVGADPDGLNRYSIRSTSGRLYAIDNMSIYNNASGSTTDFYLAEVSDAYKGKTFIVELYDPGESAGTGSLQVIDPSGAVYTGDCEVFSRDTVNDPWTQHPTPGTCSESVSPQEYNTRWLKFEIGLSSTYSCGPCWWKMNYAYTTAVNDTTTWRAYILGNPIHLVPVS
jgi:hypothetical protein